jgi:AtzH-like
MDAIRAFRRARSPINLMRRIEKAVITTYVRALRDRKHPVLPRQRARSGRPPEPELGAFPRGWRVVSAHVSLIEG